MYFYIKALHIIFVVTWFAGLFYLPRLFIYNTEAGEKEPVERDILRRQFEIMMKRLWYGITWPSAILTLALGTTVMLLGDWDKILFKPEGRWFLFKWIFLLGLFAYHFSLHAIFKQEMKGVFRYSSNQLRIWNEVATVFLFAIVFLVVVKQSISLIWGLGGLICLVILLMLAIRIYRKLRENKS
ncbi:CopD family protein [Flavihumibacter sp. UBA7668]|uniref:CopD family protein n=1 Tax=Flavihumibacter sp. UBA7668 TaxID=1946542 RepID=UPI0025BEEC28|nr:CopD family protein [Flavihumibacter sp. UBA7668]